MRLSLHDLTGRGVQLLPGNDTKDYSAMQQLDGKMASQEICNRIAGDVERLKKDHGVTPGLAVVIAGSDPASQVYVRNKVRKALELGLHSVKHELPASVSLDELLTLVSTLNRDPAIHGILVQSPAPPGIDERAVNEAIVPAKDVDCFHPYNVGVLTIGDEDGMYPCTPHGIMALLDRYRIPTDGQHAVIVGRSTIVGRPSALLLLQKRRNATVTICHSRTRDLAAITRTADILIVAIGRPGFITGEMVKDGVVVIDVGINRVADSASASGYRLVGDVDFAAVSRKAAYVTPVPGGVGPMTIALLMHNTVKACCRQRQLPYSSSLY